VDCQLTLESQLVSSQRLSRGRWHGILVGVSAPAASPSAAASAAATFAVSVAATSFILIRLPDVKGRHVDQSGVSAGGFASMFLEAVRLEVQLGLKHHKLLVQAFAIGAYVMVLFEVLLQGIVVEVVMRLSRISSIADEATLMLHATVFVQFVIVVEALAAETAQGVALEARLVGSAGLIVTTPHVLLQLLVGKELVFVRKDLFISSAEVAHSFPVY
jgi:hypothetical protein